MVEIKINIEKKDLFLIGAIIVFLVGVGIIIASNGNSDPNIHGHPSEEIEGLEEGMQKRISEECPNGQSIKKINEDGTVVCEVDDIGSKGTLKCKSSSSICSSEYVQVSSYPSRTCCKIE